MKSNGYLLLFLIATCLCESNSDGYLLTKLLSSNKPSLNELIIDELMKKNSSPIENNLFSEILGDGILKQNFQRDIVSENEAKNQILLSLLKGRQVKVKEPPKPNFLGLLNKLINNNIQDLNNTSKADMDKENDPKQLDKLENSLKEVISMIEGLKNKNHKVEKDKQKEDKKLKSIENKAKESKPKEKTKIQNDLEELELLTKKVHKIKDKSILTSNPTQSSLKENTVSNESKSKESSHVQLDINESEQGNERLESILKKINVLIDI